MPWFSVQPMGMRTMVVLAPVLDHLVARRGLDVGARHAPFAGRGKAIFGQNGIQLLFRRVPDLLLHTAHRVVLEEEGGLIGGNQTFGNNSVFRHWVTS